MKLSYCTIAYRNERVSLPEIIFKACEWGYDAVEIWGYHLTKMSSLWEIKQALAIAGLEVSMVSPYFNFTGNAAEWKKSIARAEQFIEHAHELGASAIRCFTGRVGSRVAAVAHWQDCITGIRVIADMAKEKGINIYIETHPDTLADTTASTMRLLRGINRRNVGINYDVYNIWEAEPDNLFNSFKELYPHIKHVHVKNANTQKKHSSPFSLVHTKEADLSLISYLKNGDIEYDEYLRYLVENKFDGYVSLEWFGHDVEAAAKHEVQYLKSYQRLFHDSQDTGRTRDDRFEIGCRV